ncbi:(2Fe-2S)-binding protein [Emcibacteraceae bacterium]|jgi:isoquinoline 1-oxidoreductase subunit alpha|uniref:(2Fe-2S)-binding protein n=1 Tax=Pseudemcibacter sp. TaxID=2943293 RepID=UPI00230C0BBD|nr:(2Fe-2S)-binding protein [Kordiimonadaceae bacterium]MDA9553939.1 (2Fe-2S)-binding protein [Emcibacteraceae bacterium]MDA9770819.1 (2Fe-2S)-binding protein [Emcibacteraceae bacterium]MDC1089969.1 (2Fe-2S)-binding protein [Emcibacteraceae bacterium]
MVKFMVNGREHTFEGDEDMPLLWYLREDVKLTGTKFGCGIAQCGACTVHMGGMAQRSCSVPMAAVDGEDIVTIEGLGDQDRLHAVQRAWVEEDVAQCGFCQSGQIMAVASFLKDFPNPTDEDIDENHTNLCRCASYARMRIAIHKAAAYLRGEA